MTSSTLGTTEHASMTRSILLVSTNADLAGAPVHVALLADALTSHGEKVAVAFGEDGPVRARLDQMGIDTRVIPTMRSNFNITQDARSIASLRRLIRELRPGVIHAHSSKAGMVARIAGALCNVPVIYTVHGWGFGAGRKRSVSTLVWAIERLLRTRTSRYIAVSDHDRSVGLRRLGIAEPELVTIHNGVPDTAALARPESTSSIVMVARDAYPKDYSTVLRAMSGLSANLICIGSGTDTPAFRQLAERLVPDNNGRLQLLGVRSDVDQLLASCGIFVLSSCFEGLPISIIEAMRAGLPIVASDVGGVPELVVEGRNGFLFENGNADALRTILARLANDPELRKRLGAESRKVYLERFSVERMVTRTRLVYRAVLCA